MMGRKDVGVKRDRVRRARRAASVLVEFVATAAIGVAGVAGCGDDGGSAQCDFELSFEVTASDGHAQPLGAAAGEARAGRLSAADSPVSPSGLGVWSPGDFVLANDRVAMIIEDVGPSDLYDPWGGKPVGVMRVEGGALVEPADFGEFFILTGRYSVLSTSVTVLNDGSDGGAAVVRAAGVLRPTPFFENIVGALLRDDFDDIPTAIDYVLEPNADHVDIFVVHHSPRTQLTEVPTQLHGFMYTPRTPTYAPGVGFDTASKKLQYLAFVDDDATSWAYIDPDEELGTGVSASGFTSNINSGFQIAACGETRRHHARVVIGGPGLDGLREAVARSKGETTKTISGVVRDSSGQPVAGVRVHAQNAENPETGYITRAMSGADGAYTLHVPENKAVRLTGWRRGDALTEVVEVAATETTADLTMPLGGSVHITIEDDAGTSVPARIQLQPMNGSAPAVPRNFGEPPVVGGRLQVVYALDGDETVTAPAGDWLVTVSRGYEYELFQEQVTVSAGMTAEVAAVLDHVVDTTNIMCADYHIHTNRSADSPDDSRQKVSSAIADGVEIPIRSEHEYVASFNPLIKELGASAWAFGVTSVELTTMETFGHFGVLPLEPDASAVNGGTPLWQRFPSAGNPDAFLETLEPPELFAQVRARPEEPIVIINHPRGGANYFDYAGFDAATGLPMYPQLWDEDFRVVEVFNDSSWTESRDRTVADWLSMLSSGRKVFAVGSSDSHRISGSPVGYPRTCLELGTDDPTALTPNMIRDATAAGNATIVGGIYLDVSVGDAGPGDEVVGATATATVQIKLQAASWVDVDWIEVLVDGVVSEKIAVLPEDAEAGNATVRFNAPIDVQVAPGAGSYIIVAAYGDATLEPVHPGRLPFAVTNPIFLRQ